MESPSLSVTAVSALDGFVLKVPPAQEYIEYQLHVHLITGVTLTYLAGWMVATLQ